jgi:hypothetical protein
MYVDYLFQQGEGGDLFSRAYKGEFLDHNFAMETSNMGREAYRTSSDPKHPDNWANYGYNDVCSPYLCVLEALSHTDRSKQDTPYHQWNEVPDHSQSNHERMIEISSPESISSGSSEDRQSHNSSDSMDPGNSVNNMKSVMPINVGRNILVDHSAPKTHVSPKIFINPHCKEAEAAPIASPTANPRSSYRRQTACLIDELDKLLDLPLAAHVRVGKALKLRPARSKPRARNIVLRQAVDLIWKLQCDEQVSRRRQLNTHLPPRLASLRLCAKQGKMRRCAKLPPALHRPERRGFARLERPSSSIRAPE